MCNISSKRLHGSSPSYFATASGVGCAAVSSHVSTSFPQARMSVSGHTPYIGVALLTVLDLLLHPLGLSVAIHHQMSYFLRKIVKFKAARYSTDRTRSGTKSNVSGISDDSAPGPSKVIRFRPTVPPPFFDTLRRVRPHPMMVFQLHPL